MSAPTDLRRMEPASEALPPRAGPLGARALLVTIAELQAVVQGVLGEPSNAGPREPGGVPR